MTYNFDPDSDESKALQLLAISIKPIKVERISLNIVRWTFGSTFGSGDYRPEIIEVDQSCNVEPTLEEPSE